MAPKLARRVYRWGLLAAFACRGEAPTSPAVPSTVVRPEMVAGEALAALGPDGRMRLPTPTLQPRQVSANAAQTLATGYALYVTNNASLRSIVESHRGGTWVDPHLMRLCGTPLLIRSPLRPFDARTLPPEGALVLGRQMGPKWAVPMCGSKGDVQMVVQVAIDSNSVVFDGGRPVGGGNVETALTPYGVPVGHPDPLPISIERVIEFLWRSTGARVLKIPDLFARGTLVGPAYSLGWAAGVVTCNVWRVELEREIQARRPFFLDVVSSRVVYVAPPSCGWEGRVPTVMLPTPDQPANVHIAWNSLENGTPQSIRVPVSPEVPLALEAVAVVR